MADFGNKPKVPEFDSTKILAGSSSMAMAMGENTSKPNSTLVSPKNRYKIMDVHTQIWYFM